MGGEVAESAAGGSGGSGDVRVDGEEVVLNLKSSVAGEGTSSITVKALELTVCVCARESAVFSSLCRAVYLSVSVSVSPTSLSLSRAYLLPPPPHSCPPLSLSPYLT